MIKRAHMLGLLSGLLLLVAGCQQETAEPLQWPKGWQGNSTYWWQATADTTGLYRDLSSMESMGVPGTELLTMRIDAANAVQMQMAQAKFNQYVKESLIELYRNEPHIVDSLFDRFVVPRLEGVDLTGDVQQRVGRQQTVAYRTLSRHFRYPRPITRLGEDIPIVVPDSLKNQEINGVVFIQVALNKEGVPIALKKLESVHPTLDRIAMIAMTQMRFSPAYVLRGGMSQEIPSWTRMKVRFGKKPPPPPAPEEVEG